MKHAGGRLGIVAINSRTRSAGRGTDSEAASTCNAARAVLDDRDGLPRPPRRHQAEDHDQEHPITPPPTPAGIHHDGGRCDSGRRANQRGLENDVSGVANRDARARRGEHVTAAA